ncbi:MAG: serine hydrolase domain-containing protein, partial [Planctomycetota bacterium]
LCRRILSQKPPTPPRQAFVYSNAGFIVAGHIAEVATGKSFETLLRELLFVPLDMQSAGFGAPGTNNNLDQPRGHDAAGKPVQPRPNGDNVPLLGPAGTVHASLADWGKFLRLHLLGDAADVQVGAITLHRETIARLHTAWDDAKNPYAYGFSMPHRDWARGLHTVLTHSGSNTMWFCVCWLDPSSGFGVLAVANSAGHDAIEACDRVSGLLLNNWLARRKLAEQAKPAEAMPAVTPAFPRAITPPANGGK